MEFVEQFLESLESRNSSSDTIINYSVDLKIFLTYLQENNIDVLSVTLQDLNKYSVYLKGLKKKDGKYYAESTIRRRTSSVKSFYQFLAESEIIDKNPSANFKMPKVEIDNEPKHLTEKEIKRLFDATLGERFEQRDRLMIEIFIITGIRISEMANLNKKDIKNGIMTINKGKGNKTRHIRINNNLNKKIEKYIKENSFGEPLFVSNKGTRFNVRSIRRTVDKYIKKARLNKGYSVHTLRHTAGTLMLKNKVDVLTIQEILGHESINTTKKYAHVLDKAKYEASSVMDKVLKNL